MGCWAGMKGDGNGERVSGSDERIECRAERYNNGRDEKLQVLR